MDKQEEFEKYFSKLVNNPNFQSLEGRKMILSRSKFSHLIGDLLLEHSSLETIAFNWVNVMVYQGILKEFFLQMEQSRLTYNRDITNDLQGDEVTDMLDSKPNSDDNKSSYIFKFLSFLELKPNLMGVGLNLNKLIDTYFERKKTKP